MVDVQIIAEPLERASSKHAHQFYAELLNMVEAAGLSVKIDSYTGKPGFEPEQAPILICHGTFAAEIRKTYQPTFSIILGSRGWSGFNVALYNILDNTVGSSHPGAVKPNPYHFIMDPSMVAGLKKALKNAKNLLVTNAEPSPVDKPLPKTASGLFTYSVNPDLFKGHSLEDYQNVSVGHTYPAITTQSLIQGQVVKPMLYRALEHHAHWVKHKDEPSQVKALMAIGDLIGIRHAAQQTHGEEAKAVTGKINHALDKFLSSGLHDLQMAEHIGVLTNTYRSQGGDHAGAEALATMALRESSPMMKAANAQKDLDLWHTWNTSRQPEDLSKLMNQVAPLVIHETNKWQQTGINRRVLDGKARTLAYEAITSYDPKRSQLNTHIVNHLQKLNRFAIANQNAVRIQEEKVFQYRKFLHAKNELETRLGRNASVDELTEEIHKMGEGMLVKDFKPIIENYYSTASEAGGAPVMEELSSDATAMHLARQAMNDRQKFIFNHTYGFQGSDVKSNTEIASHFGVSPAMISKQKRQIDKLVKDHIDASRYLLSSI